MNTDNLEESLLFNPKTLLNRRETDALILTTQSIKIAKPNPQNNTKNNTQNNNKQLQHLKNEANIYSKRHDSDKKLNFPNLKDKGTETNTNNRFKRVLSERVFRVAGFQGGRTSSNLIHIHKSHLQEVDNRILEEPTRKKVSFNKDQKSNFVNLSESKNEQTTKLNDLKIVRKEPKQKKTAIKIVKHEIKNDKRISKTIKIINLESKKLIKKQIPEKTEKSQILESILSQKKKSKKRSGDAKMPLKSRKTRGLMGKNKHYNSKTFYLDYQFPDLNNDEASKVATSMLVDAVSFGERAPQKRISVQERSKAYKCYI